MLAAAREDIAESVVRESVREGLKKVDEDVNKLKKDKSIIKSVILHGDSPIIIFIPPPSLPQTGRV